MNKSNFTLPLSDEILMNYNFFELYPPDGGGYFINNEIAGGWDDRQVAENILNGALNDFGKLPKLDYTKYERWRTIEKSCWLSRMYFIVPLAKYYKKTNDENIAALVKNIILHFIRTHRPPQTPAEIKNHIDYVYDIRDRKYNRNSFEENQKDTTDVKYIWFDFQPASRIIHLFYALHFLKKSSSFSSTEFCEIIDAIKDHAHLIATSESLFEKLKSPGNHQSLRGLALLYAGAILEDNFFLDEGIRICKFHIENDYFADGVLKEISPSYHMFETWHVRDAYLLSRKHGFKISSKHKEVLSKAVQFAYSIRQPDDYSTVIDDGYAFYLPPFLESFPAEIFKKNWKQEDCKSYYSDAQLAFFKDNRQFICFDASLNPGKFSHYHAGKNNITYIYDGQAILIDSGCCSYDDPLFSYYKSAQAHSSLLVDGTGDGGFSGLYNCPNYAFPECSDWVENRISARIGSSVPSWKGVNWNRKLKLFSDGIEICDQVENTSGMAKEFTFIFNLHPQVECRIIDSEKILLSTDKWSFILSFNVSIPIEIMEKSGQCFIDSEHKRNSRLHVKIKSGKGLFLNTQIRRTCSHQTECFQELYQPFLSFRPGRHSNTNSQGTFL